jgi:hypothetical protein
VLALADGLREAKSSGEGEVAMLPTR